mgnify:CR=1 FL=1
MTFYNRDYPQLLQEIDRAIFLKTACFISTPTTEIIGDSLRDPEMMTILKSATLRIPDSVTLVLLAKLLGKKIPKRLTGIDTIYNLGQSTTQKYRVFYLGAKPEIVRRARECSSALFPAFDIVGVHHGYYQEKDVMGIIEDINQSQADIVFVGLGFPKQEKFIYRYHKQLKVPVMMTVGGSFDVISGSVKRAPRWLQNLGLEWAYRFIQQPSRIRRMVLIPLYLFHLFFYELRHRRV